MEPQQIGVITEVASAARDGRLTALEMQRIIDAVIAFSVILVAGTALGAMVRSLARAMLEPEPKKVVRPVSDVLLPATGWPAPHKEPQLRQQSQEIIDSVKQAIDETARAASVKRIERVLDKIDPRALEHEVITGVDDLRTAIEDYRAITREGLTPEEYREEKEAAFEAVVEAVEGLDIDEAALEELERPAPVEPAPPMDLRSIADRYGWWAARRADAFCPLNDMVCVEREAKRLYEIVSYRREKW